MSDLSDFRDIRVRLRRALLYIAKFENDMKIGNSVISDHDRQSLQEDLHKISSWSDQWEMSFNINKCHILHVVTRKQKFQYEMCAVKLASIHCVKDLGVMIVLNVKFSLHCKEAVCKANRKLGFINRIFLQE